MVELSPNHQGLTKSLMRTVVRPLQRRLYDAALRLRSRHDTSEITSIATYDSRMVTQYAPIEGDDEFLFHRDHDALDQLRGIIVLRQRQIDVWIAALRSRKAWCDAHGAAMRFLIVPEKHIVYQEKLPRIRPSPNRAAMQLLQAMDADLSTATLYPLDELRLASKERTTFHKTDTHWNAYGAFIAYQSLMRSLESEVPLVAVSADDLAWKTRPFVGDLGVRYGDERSETIEVAQPTASYKLVFENSAFGRGAVHVFENERRDLPTCVLYRDSFSNFLIPYLMHGFSRLVAVSSTSCHYDLLEQEKPDVVIFAIIERFIATFWTGTTIQLPEDETGLSFEAFSGTQLQALRREG